MSLRINFMVNFMIGLIAVLSSGQVLAQDKPQEKKEIFETKAKQTESSVERLKKMDLYLTAEAEAGNRLDAILADHADEKGRVLPEDLKRKAVLDSVPAPKGEMGAVKLGGALRLLVAGWKRFPLSTLDSFAKNLKEIENTALSDDIRKVARQLYFRAVQIQKYAAEIKLLVPARRDAKKQEKLFAELKVLVEQAQSINIKLLGAGLRLDLTSMLEAASELNVSLNDIHEVMNTQDQLRDLDRRVSALETKPDFQAPAEFKIGSAETKTSAQSSEVIEITEGYKALSAKKLN